MDDLKAEAVCGLMEAAMRYEPLLREGMAEVASFQTYAYIWIRKFVLRAIRKFGTPLSVPCNYDEGVELLHLDVMKDDLVNGCSSGDDNGSLADRLLYAVAAAEEAEREATQTREALVEQLLEGLTAKERKVLECLFGLDGMEMSCQETAELLGVAPGRVSQLKERALRKLEMQLAA